MWYLVAKTGEAKTSYLLCNRTYKIGRAQVDPTKNPDLALNGDSSVSRLHAEILIKFNEAQCTNLDTQPNITLTDHSRYGTFVNDNKVNEIKSLGQNDMIRFGMNNSYFKLIHEPLVITTSCVQAKNKLLVKKLVCQLGGHLVNEWQSECSLVIMDRLTSTVKVMHALIGQKFIVTKQYLEDMITNASELKTSTPDPTDYLPPLAEDNLEDVSFQPDPNRKSLFKSKEFVFFSQDQLNKMKNLIEIASGKCSLFNKTRHLNKKSLQSNENLLFLSAEEISDGAEYQTELVSLLSSLNQRIIDETEIGLAVLFASTKKHCNSFKPDKTMTQAPAVGQFKLGSQSIAESVLFDNGSIKSNTQYNDIIMAAFDTQDSAPFEFERDRVNDTVKIQNTPERKKKSRLAFNICKEADEKLLEAEQVFEIPATPEKEIIEIPETPEKESIEEKPTKRRSVETSSSKSPVFIEKRIKNTSPDQCVLNKQKTFDKSHEKLKKTLKTNETCFNSTDTLRTNPSTTLSKKSNLIADKIELNDQDNIDAFESFMSQGPTLSTSIANAKKKTNEKLISVKIEPSSSVEVPKSSPLTYNKSKGLVLSKIKNENCLKVEQTNPDFQTSQLKIKFASLIKKVLAHDQDTQSVLTNGGKKNFKKFRKIPKNTKATQQTTGQFKSIKTEGFDVNTQFDDFMSQLR